MEMLEEIMNKLAGCVLAKLDDLSEVEAQEMALAMDMLKDVSMAMYYMNFVRNNVDDKIKI